MRLCGALLLALAGGIQGGAVEDPTVGDLRRAQAVRPREALRGRTYADIAERLDAAAVRAGAVLRSCAGHELRELDAVLAALRAHTSPALQAVYAARSDARAAPPQADHEGERAAAEAGGEALLALRDGKCMEAQLLWAHHLTSAARERVAAQGVQLPGLPRQLRPKERLPAEVAARYQAQSTCAIGHGAVKWPPPAAEALHPDAPKWPPVTEPVFPRQWTAKTHGWATDSQHPTGYNFTGTWYYDYPSNRLRNNVFDAKHMANVSQYWFADPAVLPSGSTAQPGRLYIVIHLPTGSSFCAGYAAYPGFSVLRPDAFAQAQRAYPDSTYYATRELRDGRWADKWIHAFSSPMQNHSCDGNFTLWVDASSGEPVSDAGPNGCTGDIGETYWRPLTLGAPPDAVFSDFDFTPCKPTASEGELLAALPAHAASMLAAAGPMGRPEHPLHRALRD